MIVSTFFHKSKIFFEQNHLVLGTHRQFQFLIIIAVLPWLELKKYAYNAEADS